ncbi:Tuberous sclerosis 2-like protein [Thecaphora frezii]
MDPSKVRAAPPMATASSAGSSSKSTFSQQILRSFRVKPSSSAPHTAATALAPITTTTSVLTPSNPFDHAAPNNAYEPISPCLLPAATPPNQPNDYAAHIQELRRPLPASPAARDDAIQQRIPRIRALLAAVQRQSSPQPAYNEDVPLADVFRLCTLLLTGEQPQPIRIEACELLTASVKLADLRSAKASKALSELRSGAPGSLSSKVPDSDQPLASIDRALFYRLVLTLSSNKLEDVGPDNIRAVLNGLPSQLRALEVLTKDGRDVVGFPDLLLSLTRWLALAWREVQSLRLECKKLQQQREPRAERPGADAGEAQHDAEAQLVARLSAVEWDVQATLHLLMSILKYSFPRIPLAHAEMALRSAAVMILGEPPRAPAAPARDAVRSPTTRTVSLAGSSRSRSRTLGTVAHRSKSRDARPLMDGYSYYGLETISSASSEAPSPALTPRPASTKAGHAEGADAPVASTPSTVAAPITLATIAPSRTAPTTASGLPKNSEDIEGRYFFGPEIHIAEVRSILKLLDATLRYGYLPPNCVDIVMQMLCRLLGYPLVDPLAPGYISLDVDAATDAWRGDIWPIFSHILRSHCANAGIRAVREVLLERQDTGGPQASPEDPAVLVGALSFFRSAMAHISEYEAEKAASQAASSSAKPQAEDALAPSLSLSLIMPALRGALRRHCDLLDLEVLNLVADLLPYHADPAEASPAAKAREPHIRRIATTAFTHGDWDALLDLTVEAKRHVEGWKLRGGAVGPFTASGVTQGDTTSGAQTGSRTRSEVDLSPAVQAMLGVLSRLQIAPPPRSAADAADEDADRRPAEASEAGPTLPWTPKLAALLLSLAPILPDSTIVDLVQYYRSQHLCLPSNPDWITNIRALLQAFYHRHEQMLDEFGVAPAPLARRKLVSLLFDHVYSAVEDLDRERNTLMLEIILPLANSTLFAESDSDIEQHLRRALVNAAVLSGSRIPGPIDPEAEQEAEPLREQAEDSDHFEEVFVEVRRLLCRLARSSDSTGPLRQHDFEADRASIAAATAGAPATASGVSGSRPNGAGGHDSTEAKSTTEKKATNAALDLIAIFNRMAFNTPWIASSVDPQVDRAVRRKWEKQTRAGCIAIYRDLLDLLRPSTKAQASPSVEKVVSPTRLTKAPSSPPESPPAAAASILTRLVILEWFVRFRTDRQHRVYLVGDLDEVLLSSAALLGKGLPASDSDGTNGDAIAVSRPQAAARTEREGRDMQRGAEALNRSRSRLRELSRDRGRPERVSDGPRRAMGERNRSSSQTRRRASNRGHLWRLPITILFEMPKLNLRSDLIYTYIHLRHDRECCPGQTHTLAEGEAVPAPLPVSEFLSTAISIMEHEPDWELLSYLICHLPHILANKHLFSGPRAQMEIIKLRRMLCEGILHGSLYPKLMLPEDIKKTDVYAVSYAMLTVLLSYRTLFSRSEQDELVEAFIAGLNKSQNTAQPCIRALSVACYELQKSVTRLLSGMLVKLSTVMSSMTMSVHILELIMAIAHTPACYANFTEADYRRVFGISLQYIQYHQSTAATSRDDWRSNPASFSLSQYVMMMAYYNISLWFMTLKISDRPKHVPYISRGLLLANEGMEKLTDQTEVCFDFLARCTHSNADPKPKRSFINNLIMGSSSVGPSRPKDAGKHSKTWMMGKGLLTVTSLKRQGWVEILVRRPSGTTSMLCKLENVPASMLPDENGERVDLPAILMMSRDPDILRAPTLTAPLELPQRRSIRQRAEERLQLSEQLRRHQPQGPAYFGLARKPRAASFSGAVSSLATRQPAERSAGGSNPYRQPDGARVDDVSEEGRTVDETSGVRNGDSSEAMRELMRDILSEDPKAAIATTVTDASKTIGSKDMARKPSGGVKPLKDAAVDPGFVALQLSSFPDMVREKAPILLPDEPATDRMIRAVDLTPVVDFHKIGVLYVAPGQDSETEILGNRHGSPAYVRFLAGLGHLITLKGQEDVYTGGLDRQMDEHGKYAYVWTDEISQIVYHTATLMPNKEHDPSHAAKKALIGNDWVHIVFNESGREYRFGTIPSQFNFVNICVSPTSRGGANLGSATPDDAVFYRVSLQTRQGLPDFSLVGDGQLISAEALPAFVRILALTSNLMSQIYLDTGEAMQPYTGNWVSRLHHIQRFRTQLENKRRAANPNYDNGNAEPEELYDFSRTY